MWLKAALVFLLVFSVAMRAASAFSWATGGAPLTVAGLLVALAVAGVTSGIWYAQRYAGQAVGVRPRHGRFATVHWS